MKRDTQATMTALVDQWRESKMPVRDFAKNAGISKGKLEYWIRKLSKSPKSQYPAFIEIGQSHNGIIENPPHLPGKLQIELTFPSGLCLKIFG